MSGLRAFGWVGVAMLVVGSAAAGAQAVQHAGASESVLMVSDIHFDAFRDPAKVAQLRAADVGKWEAILSVPASATQTEDFAKLQSACGSRAADTDWKLFASSLRAEKERVAHPAFITLSGDLMVHQFDCRFHSTGGVGDVAATEFAAKIVAFVAGELRKTFPGVPVYVALGNNDSGCRDYDEDPGSEFLKAAGKTMAASAATALDVTAQGNYSVRLPGAMRHARLIVLQDIFESVHYGTCKGAADPAAAKAQVAWLRGELKSAREKKEAVWVMGHIPPGVDTYSTVRQRRDVCKGDAPASFLSSNDLAEALDGYADVVKLAIFAHTHMDEVRLFQDGHGDFAPGKMVPSISPVNGNHPAFTVAEVDAKTASLTDYSVFVSSDDAGSAWSEEYRYSKTYGEKDFSGASAARLVGELKSEKGVSLSYMRFYSAGDKGLRALALGLVWPQYACSIAHDSEADYRNCVCSAGAAAGGKP